MAIKKLQRQNINKEEFGNTVAQNLNKINEKDEVKISNKLYEY